MSNFPFVSIAALFLFVGNCLAFTCDPNAANVFFVHGFNVSEQGARAWAAAMFKGLFQSGARMNFHPVSWKSDAGASWNYHANVSNLDTGLTGESVQFLNRYSAFDASQLSLDHLRTNAVFQLEPSSITNSAMSRFEADCHLAQGIPALSCAAGITDLSDIGILSIDINSTAYRPNGWPAGRAPPLANRWLHSDIKDVAYFYTYKVFEEIVRIGGLK